MTTVDRIFQIMKKNNLTAKDFANKVGVSQGNITDWKTGRAKPSVSSLNKIAKCFNVSIDYLLGNIDRISYKDTLIRYLKPLNFSEKEFDLFKKISIDFLSNETPENIASIIKALPNTTKNKILDGIEIITDLSNEYDKSTRLNKISYLISKFDGRQEPIGYEALIENRDIDNVAKDGLIEAINSIDQNSIVSGELVQYYMCPVYSQILAAQPILAEQYIEGYLPIDPNTYGETTSDNLFYLKISDESMNLKVKNGDYVLIRKQDYAEDGDIIIAIANDEATLKRYKKLNDQFILLEPMSTDPSIEAITIDLKNNNFKIIGKAIGQFGKF